MTPTKDNDYNNAGKYALITGGTSGIGYELARLFAKDGYNLVIVARLRDRLNEVTHELSSEYGIKVVPIVKDLFQPGAAEEIYDEVTSWGISVDVLANNAGQAEYGKFADVGLQRHLDIINLNIVTPMILTKLFLREMLARNEGKILQLSSLLGKIPSPYTAVYAGTKSFMLNFSESLAEEIKDTNVTITALLPGATDTDFFHKANEQDSTLYRESDLADPAKVASDGYEALMKGERKIVSGGKNKMQVGMAAVTPDETLAKQMGKQTKPSDEAPDGGRTRTTHLPSAKERAKINEITQGVSGDISTREASV